ncbi:MAG TPA: N-acetyltransferase [Reyranella sp.]|nr:N-acetyltransferase [Reyranella sp.]
MNFRPRQPADDAAIAVVNDLAFGGPAESRLVTALRDSGAAAIELVATEHGEIVGHILFSVLGVTVDERPVSTLALAPVAVRPDRQRAGIGSALVRAGLERARAAGWEAVIVLGHPAYYPRFGFSAALARPLVSPFSGNAFMALALRDGALDGRTGRVVHPPAFGAAS